MMTINDDNVIIWGGGGGGGGGGGDAKKNIFLGKKFAKPIKSRIFFSQLRISIKK